MERYKFGTPELKSTFKVLLWTVASALVVFLIDMLGAIEIPVQYLTYVPLVNVVLYAIKEWLANNK